LLTASLLKVQKKNSYTQSPFKPVPHELTLSIPSTLTNKTKLTPAYLTLFKEYWLLHQTRLNVRWTTHQAFKTMFFVSLDRQGSYNVIGLSKFYLRWKNAHTLLLNLFFFESSIFTFTNKLFLEEALVFNWNLNFVEYKFFKFSQNLIYFRDNPYGHETDYLFDYFNQYKLDAAIVTDLKTHEKNIFFMKRFNFYIIGLNPSNYNPELFSFPIPLLGDSLLGQHHFLESMLRILGLARRTKFEKLQKTWTHLTWLLKNKSTFNFF